MAQWLTERLGQPVIVENRPGGGTNIATQAVVNSPPDGYTLLFTASTHTINVSLQTLPFNFLRDITPVAGLTELPLVLDVHPKVPAKTSRVHRLRQGQSGQGQHRLVRRRRPSAIWPSSCSRSTTGIDVVHVPYPGGAPMMTDSSPGRSRPASTSLPNSLPHIKSGAIRALALMSRGALDRAARRADHRARSIPGFEVRTAPASACRAARRRRSSSASTARSTPALANHDQGALRRGRRLALDVTSARGQRLRAGADREMGAR